MLWLWKQCPYHTLNASPRNVTTSSQSGTELRPLKFYVEVLTPSTSECDCIWIKGLIRGDYAKMSPFRWAVIQSDGCPPKKGAI